MYVGDDYTKYYIIYKSLADRTGVSDRSAAITASTMLYNIKIIKPENKIFIIVHLKLLCPSKIIKYYTGNF